MRDFIMIAGISRDHWRGRKTNRNNTSKHNIHIHIYMWSDWIIMHYPVKKSTSENVLSKSLEKTNFFGLCLSLILLLFKGQFALTESKILNLESFICSYDRIRINWTKNGSRSCFATMFGSLVLQFPLVNKSYVTGPNWCWGG